MNEKERKMRERKGESYGRYFGKDTCETFCAAKITEEINGKLSVSKQISFGKKGIIQSRIIVVSDNEYFHYEVSENTRQE